VVEYVGHLHEHFLSPVVVTDGRYRLPTSPGYCVAMYDDSLVRYGFPDGEVWKETAAASD
jgi:L-fuconate dehydratase